MNVRVLLRWIRVVLYRRHYPQVGRNDLCPCGSGQKNKKCGHPD